MICFISKVMRNVIKAPSGAILLTHQTKKQCDICGVNVMCLILKNSSNKSIRRFCVLKPNEPISDYCAPSTSVSISSNNFINNVSENREWRIISNITVPDIIEIKLIKNRPPIQLQLHLLGNNLQSFLLLLGNNRWLVSTEEDVCHSTKEI